MGAGKMRVVSKPDVQTDLGPRARSLQALLVAGHSLGVASYCFMPATASAPTDSAMFRDRHWGTDPSTVARKCPWGLPRRATAE